jgi:hypothetical protein
MPNFEECLNQITPAQRAAHEGVLAIVNKLRAEKGVAPLRTREYATCELMYLFD